MSSKGKDVSKLRLTLVQGDNYANPTGDYSRTTDIVRDKNIWVGNTNQRMMFYRGDAWVITDTKFMDEIKAGATGGFVASNASFADTPYEADWGPNYTVSEVYLTAEARWVPATDVYGSPAVHVWWSAPGNPEVQQQGITWFYNEVMVKETADSTYFMTNGFTGGYMGIQERSPKWVLFSVWDKGSTDEDPNTPPDDLTHVLAKGEGVTVRRFGGEGTGTQSFLPYDWNVGSTHQLMVNVKPAPKEDDKVIFSGWFRIPEKNIWRLMASIKVRPMAASKKLEGLYSFLEDWMGNGLRRVGEWGPAWIRSDSGPWVQATHGKGTTTEQNSKSRNVFLSEGKRRIGMTSGGPALSDQTLGPYDVVNTPIPSVLTLNPLPDGDGSPARDT